METECGVMVPEAGEESGEEQMASGCSVGIMVQLGRKNKLWQ